MCRPKSEAVRAEFASVKSAGDLLRSDMGPLFSGGADAFPHISRAERGLVGPAVSIEPRKT